MVHLGIGSFMARRWRLPPSVPAASLRETGSPVAFWSVAYEHYEVTLDHSFA